MMGIRIDDLSPEAQKQALSKLLQEQEKKAASARPRSKYGNVKATRGNLHFDSKKEAHRFEDLLLMEQAGGIRNLRLQQDFTLQEAYTLPTGERVRAIRYKADFTYERRMCPDECGGWVPIVEDVKSRPTRTKEYIIKRKLIQDKLGITITEV